jgi:hypothetical protein
MVSEESGQISMADRGKINRGLSHQDIEIILTREFRGGGRRSEKIDPERT